MKSYRTSWALTAAAAALLSGGCGDNAANTATAPVKAAGSAMGKVGRGFLGLVKKPVSAVGNAFSESEDAGAAADDRNFGQRTSGDSYAIAGKPGTSRTTARSHQARPVHRPMADETTVSEEGMAQVLGSNPTDPMQADVKHLTSTLEEELRRLQATEKLMWDKQSIYNEKEKELQALKSEYEMRLDSVRRKRSNLERVMQMVNEDPSVISEPNFGQMPVAGWDGGLSSPEGDVSSCAGDWTDSEGALAPSDRMDTTFMPAPGAWAPSNNEGVVAPPMTTAPTAPAPADPFADLTPQKTTGEIKTNILAMDGSGADATVILGAGSEQGVERGMIFASGEGKEAKVLVVTKAYPTYARAVMHPKYAGDLSVRDEVKQIERMPEIQSVQ